MVALSGTGHEHYTREGRVYCAVVLDTYSRRVVGWSIDSTQTAALVTNALGMATSNRSPEPGTIIHSDHGVELIDGKIGKTPDPKYLADRQKEWNIRAAANVPPGYKDSRKGDRSIGDYLVWHQTMEEAKAKRRREMPVLMICNEQKPDWVRRDGAHSGPRHELVKEMRDTANQDFHLVDVHDFLTLANEHLSARISETTVDQAFRLGDGADSQEIERRLSELRRAIERAAYDMHTAHARYSALYDRTSPFDDASSRQQLQRAAEEAQRTARVCTELQQEAAALYAILPPRLILPPRIEPNEE